MQLYKALQVAGSPGCADNRPDALLVRDDRFMAVGRSENLLAQYPTAVVRDLGCAIILPGFVNAHQHGRGLSQLQLGLPDDQLEPWITRRRGRNPPDIYGVTRLAAEQMIRNGVTSTLHANYSYGTGDYEAELRETIRAYRDSGIRTTICIGYADRGALIYPPGDERAFRATLSPEAEALVASARAAYLPLSETLALMARLRAELADTPRIKLAYGPAGPQWVSDEAWRAIAKDAARCGAGIHFHALESAAQARAMRQLYPEGVIERLRSLGVFETSVSVAHFTHATPADISAARQLGVTVVANPGSNLRLCNGAPPLAKWRAAGLQIAVGTDNCALDDNEDYLSELRLAGLLCRGSGSAPLSSPELLAMGTLHGARAAFLTETGSITPGMPADFTAISSTPSKSPWADPDCDALDLLLARGCGDHVVLTVIDGEVAYRFATPPAKDRILLTPHTAPEARPAADALAEAVRHHYRG